MKVMGLIGGMSWESSLEYYRIMNEEVRERLGGQHSAKILMFSVDFHEIEACQVEDRWEDATALLTDAARRLERGGADYLLICTNTMHKVADGVQRAVSIPLLHIGDATAEEVKRLGLSSVGLLGTRYTMEQDFLKGYLSSRHGLEVIVPGEEARTAVHDIIYDELCLGKLVDESKERLLSIVAGLAADGAEGVILGCTELPLLLRPDDSGRSL
ncbi:MAG: aspartate/glutamate racemase family protein [Deltaproteobacteria bacterium]